MTGRGEGRRHPWDILFLWQVATTTAGGTTLLSPNSVHFGRSDSPKSSQATIGSPNGAHNVAHYRRHRTHGSEGREMEWDG